MFRFIVVLLLLVIFVLLFQTRSIKVKGNEYYGENSIISWLKKDKLSMNTVYLFWKYNLWREECTILFVGYQAMGTLGRRLIEGEKNVKLFGEPIEVKARIESLHGISGHADMNGLLKWLGAFKEAPQRVFVVHGEDTVTEEFAKTVEEKFGYQAYAPFPCSEADLLTNEILSEGVKIPVKAKKPAQRKADAAFERLVAAGKRLLDVIYKNEGLANKDKAKFESQINNLSDKWDI